MQTLEWEDKIYEGIKSVAERVYYEWGVSSVRG